MKSAGVNIVASYIIWNHHEAEDGQFNWKGNRDLGLFVRLARKVGLDVVVRVGPWAHAEVRYGGIPDFIVDTMPTRRDDPQYLRYVERFYQQIGAQLKGQLYKDGGPVIGVQIENEYNIGGPGQGAGHILTLKKLALKAGLDVPFYTVTGWDRTLYPSGEVTPVFGGYPDEPWATSTRELGPKETYAFRFHSRVSGDLGAQTRNEAAGTADSDMHLTPFLGAEYGAGLPAMYRRRTLVSPDDIASMLPVQLGSGVNLMGYYMFHGGRNPVGGTTLEESTRTGGYNDTPAISYDFNAPLGPDGQQRPVLNALRPFHYFLSDFGPRLAPMTVRKPEVTPSANTDLVTPRFSVRSKGDSAFLFFSNHVRQYPMPLQKDVRFAVKLPGETVVFPSKGVDLADGSYFVWPVNFDMDGARLRYASAQPVARLDQGADGVLYVFGASAGVAPEFAFDPAIKGCLKADKARVGSDAGGQLLVDQITPGTGAAFTLGCDKARKVSVLVLTPQQIAQLSIGQLAGKRRLVISAQESYFASGKLVLRSPGKPDFKALVWPALESSPKASAAINAGARDGLFQVIEATLPARTVSVKVEPLREARNAPPVMIGGLAKAALQPMPETFKQSAAWQLTVAPGQLDGLDGALMGIDFVGDVGRLFAGTRMLDDWYYNGQLWQIDLKGIAASLKAPLTL
ncbi:MAG: beta-galactosidase, partial [Massilia sp.]